MKIKLLDNESVLHNPWPKMNRFNGKNINVVLEHYFEADIFGRLVSTRCLKGLQKLVYSMSRLKVGTCIQRFSCSDVLES